jgi:hypothetical protein
MRPNWRLGAYCLVAVALLAADVEARVYRWVDDNGVVHYTDILPPNEVDRGHAEIDERGLVIGTTAPAKTREEVRREKELERFREAAERAKKEQEAADRMLLSTFRSVDDLIMARDGQLATIEGMLKVARSNIITQQERLRVLRAGAANLERTGKPIPSQLSANIGTTERSIREAYAILVNQEQQKQAIQARFARDVNRFRQLMHIPEMSDESEQDSEPDGLLKNLIRCADGDACDRLWEKASAYVRQHASAPVQASASNTLITTNPKGPDNISLTLLRILDKQGPGATLFLDVQCKPAASGDTTFSTCTTPEAQSLLDGFHAAVMGPEEKD